MNDRAATETRLLVDSIRGVYVPLTWARRIEALDLSWQTLALRYGIAKSDLDEVLKGPDAPEYWDAWENILRDYRYRDLFGNVWTLSHEDDLFEVSLA